MSSLWGRIYHTVTNVRITRTGEGNIIAAARVRILNIFSSGLPVYLAFSGGKDSLCLAHTVVNLINENLINPKQLIVIFVDEEAIFEDVERVVNEWRSKFMLLGAKFRWYCLEVKHFNCYNELTNDESFICWDRNREKDWIRPQPPFSIKYHPMLKVGKENYQSFFPRITADGVQIIGIRLAESIQRASYFASAMKNSQGRAPIKASNAYFPIYDWNDNDVWLYLKNNHIDFPIEYLYLWQVGTAKNRLRISQFFSIDTAGCLYKLGEYYPTLMEKVVRREPNAYLASLYWDSEMFRRSSARRRKIENEVEVDYQKLTMKLLSDIDKNFNSERRKAEALSLLNRINSVAHMMIPKDWKVAHAILIAGDPKARSTRGLVSNVLSRYSHACGANTNFKKPKQKGGEGL